MTKFLNTLKSNFKFLTSQWFSFIGLLWMGVSFIYIGKAQFWIVLGFAILFTGIQNIINEIRLKN